MFFDKELKNIQEAKNKLVICSDLHRLLIQLEVRGMWSGLFATVSNLTLGLALFEQLLDFFRARKGTRR